MPTRSKSKRSKTKARKGRAKGPELELATKVDQPAGDEDWDATVSDFDVLGGRCANNAVERHVTLDHAVTNVWAAEDISMIRRIEDKGRCQWVMWRR